MVGVNHAAAGLALVVLLMSAGCGDDAQERAAPSIKSTSQPAIAARRGKSGRVIVYASWRGAREVTHWLVECARDRDADLWPVVIEPRPEAELGEIKLFRKTGFETVMTVKAGPGRVFAVQALDAAAMTLGMSRRVEPTRWPDLTHIGFEPYPVDRGSAAAVCQIPN
jgi:hypothetical protein